MALVERYEKLLKSKNLEGLRNMSHSVVFSWAASIPDELTGDLIARAWGRFKTIEEGMEGLKEGTDLAGAFLTQKELSSYTHFSQSSDWSFCKSIGTYLSKVLLNTKDKNGASIKHHLRRQI